MVVARRRRTTRADLRRLTVAELEDLAGRDPCLPRRPGLPDRRAPRPEPRRRRADPRPAPGLRLARATRIVFDTGHQAYVHKLLTGRAGLLRPAPPGGLSGYPSRAESEHDVVENSHASTALSWADGIAKAHELRGETRPARRRRHRRRRADRRDGLGGAQQHRRRPATAGSSSSSTTTGAPTRRRSAAWPTTWRPCARRAATSASSTGASAPCSARRSSGRLAYEALHGMKKGIKDVVAPQGMFEDLGLKYVGPVDGHDVGALEHALRRARAFGGPVHRARDHPARATATHRPRTTTPTSFHAIGVIDPETGRPRRRRRGRLDRASSPTRWSRIGARPPGRRRRSPPRCSSRSASHRFADALPGARLRRRHRRAARGDVGGRAWPSPGCTRSSRSTRRSSTGPSTRC